MLQQLIEAFILGILYGLGPCTLSCAPLIVPLIMNTAKNKTQGIIHSIIFSLGRVLTYTFLGFLAGLIGYTLDISSSKKIIGVFIIVLGILIFFKIPNNKCIFKSKLKITGPFIALFAGIAWGFSFCPPLLGLLAISAASGSALTGSLMAFLFGIGTIISPIILLGFFSGWFAKQKEFKDVIPYVSGLFLIIIGALYLID